MKFYIKYKIISYEIDGFGNHYKMDDANIPSLLSLPLIQFINKTNSVYLKTRNYVLSNNNPFYFKGKFANGIYR